MTFRLQNRFGGLLFNPNMVLEANFWANEKSRLWINVQPVVQSIRASYADLLSLHLYSPQVCVELCLSPSSRHPRLISSGPCLYLPNITVVFSLFWFICLFCGANSTICCLTRSWVPEAFTERDKKWHENHKAEIGGRPRCLCCLASQS